MTVLAHDPFAPADPELVELEELRPRADVITLHLPLTAQTHHLVDAAFLAAQARHDPGQLRPRRPARPRRRRAGLADGRLGGLGLDVFDPEPPAHHPVFDRDDVVLSPT